VNISLGHIGSCSLSYLGAIVAARGAGAVVVVSAGNDNLDAGLHSPGNCYGVVTVAATDSDGDRAIFNVDDNGNVIAASNFGSTVEISAPGVDVWSASDAGLTTQADHTWLPYAGTSMAAPHVAGVASLALSVRPNLTPDQVLQVLQYSVTPFPTGSTCSTSTCGAGIVNAEIAVRDIFIDKAHTGEQVGIKPLPFKIVGQANNGAWNGARLKIKAGSYPESVTFSKKVTLEAQGGTVTIGN
jgi:serine protease